MSHSKYEMDTCPVDEPSAQVGYDDYVVFAALEAQAFIQQIRRELLREPVGSSLHCVFCPHEFGQYAQIRYLFDVDNEDHLAYMYKLDDCGVSMRTTWDKEAKDVLSQTGYFEWLTKQGQESLSWQV